MEFGINRLQPGAADPELEDIRLAIGDEGERFQLVDFPDLAVADRSDRPDDDEPAQLPPGAPPVPED